MPPHGSRALPPHMAPGVPTTLRIKPKLPAQHLPSDPSPVPPTSLLCLICSFCTVITQASPRETLTCSP